MTTRRGFLNLAAVFEGATLGIGLLLGWLSGTLTPDSLRFTWGDLGWGALAVVPMLSLLVLAQDLRQKVREMLGGPLSQCTWSDLVALALLAGLSEELLFRGVLEPWIGRWDPWVGLVLANVLFGLAHAISPNYFLFAALIGVYFSLLNRNWPELGGSLSQPNLLRPVIAHALYDLIAFVVIARDYRGTTPSSEPDGEPQTGEPDSATVEPRTSTPGSGNAVDPGEESDRDA